MFFYPLYSYTKIGKKENRKPREKKTIYEYSYGYFRNKYKNFENGKYLGYNFWSSFSEKTMKKSILSLKISKELGI